MTRKEGIKSIIDNGFNVHNHFKHLSIEELKEITEKDRRSFSVMCLNLFGDLNVGTTIRAAHLLGAARVFVVGRKKCDGRSLVGADKYFNVEKYYALDEQGTLDKSIIFDIIKHNALNPIFIETGGESYTQFDWKLHAQMDKELCFVVGNEGFGIPEDVLAYNRYAIVSVPQRGVLRSFNVANAFSIVCAHYVNVVIG